MGKRHRWPTSESASLQSSRRGFDSWELVLLGPLHVELSSGHRENHPPLQQPAPPPIPADRVEVSSVLPARQKCTCKHHTHMQQRAPPPVLEQIDGRARPVFKGIDGGGKLPQIQRCRRGSNRRLQDGRRVRCRSGNGRHGMYGPSSGEQPHAEHARTQSFQQFVPPFSFSFILFGPRSLTVTPARLSHSSVHSRRHPDLAASAFASRQSLPLAVRTRRL